MQRPHIRPAAAPAGAQDVRRPSATNGMAPVTPQPGAAVGGMHVSPTIEMANRAHAGSPAETGSPTSDAGIAGMAGSAGVGCPGSTA